MKEKNYQTIFNHWLKECYKKTGVFELKRAKNDRLAFGSVKPHQVNALLNARNMFLVYKIPDVGYQNPFDCISLAGVPAYVVCIFSKSFELIDVEAFISERNKCTRKSLTYPRAQELSTISIDMP